MRQSRPRKASPFVAHPVPGAAPADIIGSIGTRMTRQAISLVGHPNHRRRRRRHHGRSSSHEEFSDSPFSSCVMAPAKYLIRKIRKGKFVKFDKLLTPVLDEVLTAQQGKCPGDDPRPRKRHIGDFANWVEAWNIFMAIRV